MYMHLHFVASFSLSHLLVGGGGMDLVLKRLIKSMAVSDQKEYGIWNVMIPSYISVVNDNHIYDVGYVF